MATDIFWQERFEQDGYYYGTKANDFLKEHALLIPQGGKVLSIGEGEGRNAVYLASLGYDVTAIDIAESGLEKIRLLAKEQGVHVHTQQADLNDYKFSEQAWDGIINIFCHLPPRLRREVHQNAAKALAPKGVLLLEAYTPNQLRYNTGGPKQLHYLYSAADLQQDFAALKIQHLAEIERDIQEGAGHTGLSSVVQVIAHN